MISYFSMALMSSVLAKSSSGAMIISLIILFIMMYIIPVGGGEFGTCLLGPEPEDIGYDHDSQLQENYERAVLDIYDFFNLFSAQSVYNSITSPITNPSFYVTNRIYPSGHSLDPDITDNIEKPSLLGIIGDKWVKIIVLSCGRFSSSV